VHDHVTVSLMLLRTWESINWGVH